MRRMRWMTGRAVRVGGCGVAVTAMAYLPLPGSAWGQLGTEELERTAPAAVEDAFEPAADASEEPMREWVGVSGALPIWEWGRATGDWAGVRTRLEERGVTVGAENILEYSEVFGGGIEEQDSFRNLFTLGVELDTDAAFDLPGGTFFIQYLSVTAENGGSADVGDLQVTSNIENDRSLDVIYELWYQQTFADERLRVKVGKVDANSEFAYVGPLREFSAAGELTNSSAGFQPTIFVFPSYPDPATSVNVFVTPVRNDEIELSFGYGLYDGAAGVDGVSTGSRGPSTFFSDDRSDDYFHIAEAQLGWADLAGLGEGSLSVGGWFHTGDFATFDGGEEDGTGGVYATFHQRLTAPDGFEAESGLFAFGQIGFSDESVAEVHRVYALGLVQVGLGDVRPDDRAGVYASFADLSEDDAAGFAQDELALELMYRAQVTPAVYVQPGLQVVVNPSGDPAVDDAVVGSVRLGITF